MPVFRRKIHTYIIITENTQLLKNYLFNKWKIFHISKETENESGNWLTEFGVHSPNWKRKENFQFFQFVNKVGKHSKCVFQMENTGEQCSQMSTVHPFHPQFSQHWEDSDGSAEVKNVGDGEENLDWDGEVRVHVPNDGDSLLLSK